MQRRRHQRACTDVAPSRRGDRPRGEGAPAPRRDSAQRGARHRCRCARRSASAAPRSPPGIRSAAATRCQFPLATRTPTRCGSARHRTHAPLRPRRRTRAGAGSGTPRPPPQSRPTPPGGGPCRVAPPSAHRSRSGTREGGLRPGRAPPAPPNACRLVRTRNGALCAAQQEHAGEQRRDDGSSSGDGDGHDRDRIRTGRGRGKGDGGVEGHGIRVSARRRTPLGVDAAMRSGRYARLQDTGWALTQGRTTADELRVGS